MADKASWPTSWEDFGKKPEGVSFANSGGSLKPLWDLGKRGPLTHNLVKPLHTWGWELWAKQNFGQCLGTFCTHLERRPWTNLSGVLLASIWGRWEATSASFLGGSMNKLVTRVKGWTSESFLELLQRSRPTEGENWPAGRREGQRGPRRVGRGRTEPGSGGRAARQPSLLAGFRAAAQMFCERAPGARGISAKRLHKQGWGQRRGTAPPPGSPDPDSGWVWAPQHVPSSAHLLC